MFPAFILTGVHIEGNAANFAHPHILIAGDEIIAAKEHRGGAVTAAAGLMKNQIIAMAELISLIRRSAASVALTFISGSSLAIERLSAGKSRPGKHSPGGG